MKPQRPPASGRPKKPLVVAAPEPLPPAFAASVYLAAPAPATFSGQGPSSGRAFFQQAIAQLTQAGFDGVVYVPDDRGPDGRGADEREARPPEAGPERAERSEKTDRPDRPDRPDRADRAERIETWSLEALRHSDAVLFFVDGESARDAAIAELWGQVQRSSRAVLIAPAGQHGDAGVAAYLRTAGRLRVPVARSVAEGVQLLLGIVRPGALRRLGERAVPLLLWRSPGFQSWYRALRRAGHRLDDAQLEWSYRSRAAGRPPLLWALRPRVLVSGERRHKSGEVVIGRTDVSATVLYHLPPEADPLDAVVVLVREFRSAVRNETGFGWNLPGGSAASASEREQDPRATARQEVLEETGLALEANQLEDVPAGDRQAASTLSCHHVFLYRAALSDAQLQEMRSAEQLGKSHGANPGERCFVSLRAVRALLAEGSLDWAQLGMVMRALAGPLGLAPGGAIAAPPPIPT